jgi:uncharacterized flavoprotein (TIGR03862 family)
MAAETLSAAGLSVSVYEKLPSVGRKFLMAGRGGLNLTHSEDFEAFVGRYGGAADRLRPILEAFPPAALIAWAQGLGQETFVGSSGRVFPRALKASPLLRAWLARLSAQGVQIHTRRAWTGWDAQDALTFATPEGGTETVRPRRATILALGGASWPRLGTDGAWAPLLAKLGVELTPFQPSNVGFSVAWSAIFKQRFQGQPLKGVALTFDGRTVRGEVMIADYGLEGGAIYALSAPLRDAVAAQGQAVVEIDLRPDLSAGGIAARLIDGRKSESLANRLRKTLHLTPAAINLLREAHGVDLPQSPRALGALIKRVPITLSAVQPIARAISTAGGVRFDALDDRFMLRACPGVFVAGEMLDWEAPTGGYLLQATFATGMAAAKGAVEWLQRRGFKTG